MAIAQPNFPLEPTAKLTYEAYLAEGEINRRYDIIDGERIFMANPTERHQDIMGNILEAFRTFQRQSHQGKAIAAPRDVMITHNPLRTRQPDVLFISDARRAQNPPVTDPAPMRAAPELVVEILSTSDPDPVLRAKLADYAAVDVRECWIVDPVNETAEVRHPGSPDWIVIARYAQGETVASAVFPGLNVSVAAIFAE